MRHENNWMLEVLVSSAAGFPVGLSKAEGSGALSRGGRDSETGDRLDPKNGGAAPSRRRKLRRILEVCRINGRTQIEAQRNIDPQ